MKMITKEWLKTFHSQQTIEKSLKGYLKESCEIEQNIFDKVCEILEVDKSESI